MIDHFPLYEWLRSETATRRRIKNEPNAEALKNIRRMKRDIMEPIRAYINAGQIKEIPITILSGYRSWLLNRIIGGSSRSAHMKGLAADCVVSERHMTTRQFAQSFVDAMGEGLLQFDQLILEFGRWVHVSGAPEGQEPRREILTAYKLSWNRTAYKPGIVMVRKRHWLPRLFFGDMVYE